MGRRERRGGWKLPLLALLVVLLAGAAAWYWWKPDTILYRDRELKAQRGVPRSKYRVEHFIPDERGRLSYEHGGKKARLGIDVSYYQGEIDWQAVAADGVEFAMIRLGYRGYGSGAIAEDERFEEYFRGAREAGLELGVYFFSQAVTVQEAQEEADFVLRLLDGRELQYPVVFDWERISPGREARTDGLDGETMTQCAAAFAQRIQDGGYQPMLYFNRDMGYLDYDLKELKRWPFWLARYDVTPDFYYDYDLWQFSHTGRVAGIEKDVDLNLDLRPAK